MQLFQFWLENEQKLVQFAENLAKKLQPNSATTIYLVGELGAGKTTFSRGFLHGLGYKGTVKSPTYTLVEPYQINKNHVFHFDLYRLSDPEEFIFLGIRDYYQNNAIFLIEWPEKGKGFIPNADFIIRFEYQRTGRNLMIQVNSKQFLPIFREI